MRTVSARILAVAWVSFTGTALATGQGDAGDGWRRDFPVEMKELRPTGRNPYFILEPGYQLELAGGRERLVITVLDETKIIDGVTTRVVEERETKDGQLVEISRNYFAISEASGDVYYFGEEVDIYKNGRVVDHEGAWMSGVNGARFGLYMPGAVAVGAKFYQEVAPKVAMDRVEITAVNGAVKTPAGEFTNCVVFRETSPLERFSSGYKCFVRGIGLVQDGAVKLVAHGPATRP